MKAGSWKQNFEEVAAAGHEVRSNEGWKSFDGYQEQRQRYRKKDSTVLRWGKGDPSKGQEWLE